MTKQPGAASASADEPRYHRHGFGQGKKAWITFEIMAANADEALRQSRIEADIAWRVLNAHKGGGELSLPRHASTFMQGPAEPWAGTAGTDKASIWKPMMEASGNDVLENENAHPWTGAEASAALRGIMRRATAGLLDGTAKSVYATIAQESRWDWEEGAVTVRCGFWCGKGQATAHMPSTNPMRTAMLACSLAAGMTSRHRDSMPGLNQVMEIPESATLRARLAAELAGTAASDTFAATAILRAVGADREARAFERLYGQTP